MATNRTKSLPTLRITAEQLRERASDISRRHASRDKPRSISTGYRAERASEGSINESLRGNSCASTPTRVQSYRDMRSQLMPTPPRPASSTCLRSMSELSGVNVSRSGRGRGQRRRSRTSGQCTDGCQKLFADDKSKNTEVKGRLHTGEERPEDNLVFVWKKYCSGKIERLVTSWSQSGTTSKLMALLDAMRKFQGLTEKLVLIDLESSIKLEVCSRLWKHGHYQVIEAFRGMGDEATADMEQFLQSSQEFYSSLLQQLQTTHQFTLADYVSGKVDLPSKTKQRAVMQAVSLCQHCYISLGDLSRYSQQLAEAPNWGKPRIFYLKAHDLAPKDGRPYNQLAVVALKTNRRLDAVYYYMRSLMAKNPFKSAHDSLVGLFEDTSTKVRRQKEEEERSRVKAEKAAARRQKRQRGKRGGGSVGEREESGEVWIMPGQADVGVTVGVVTKNEQLKEDVLESLTNTEVLKKLISVFLFTHGKLFTKTGIETINSTLTYLTHTLSRYLSDTLTQDISTHTPTTSDTQRLVQMMTINIFSIHHVADSHSDNLTSQQFYCSLSFTVAMKLTTVILQYCISALKSCKATPILQSDCTDPAPELDGLHISDSLISKVNEPTLNESSECCDSPATATVTSKYSVTELCCVDKLSVLLPCVRVWFQWVWLQREFWRKWMSGVERSEMIEFWKSVCSCLNLSLSLLPGLPSLTITAVARGCSWRFWEDRMLSGFLPLGNSLSTQDTLRIADLNTLEQQELREQVVHRVADIGRLCVELSSSTDYGLTFDLSIVKFDIPPELTPDLIDEGSPSSSPPLADPSGDEFDSASVSSDDVIVMSSDEESGGDKGSDEDESESGGDKERPIEMFPKTQSEIELLKAQKEKLTRAMEEQSQALQAAKNLLEEVAKTERAVMRITPKYLVPDTNCFVDLLDSIKDLISTTQFIIAIPLVVLTELEGLSRGAGEKQSTSTQTATGSRCAVEYVERWFTEKCAYMKCLTTQGSLLSSLSFRAEVTDKASNDNLILESCLKLHTKVDGGDQHSVVLLTDDRNLRVKAHASKLPVKDMPSFMKLLPRN